MKPWFDPNIGTKGRLIRGFGALALLVGAGFGFAVSVWLGVVLLASGTFVLFESLRGWCALRAASARNFDRTDEGIPVSNGAVAAAPARGGLSVLCRGTESGNPDAAVVEV
jgi:hypothetical protein